jgi:hypothetical protein
VGIFDGIACSLGSGTTALGMILIVCSVSLTDAPDSALAGRGS